LSIQPFVGAGPDTFPSLAVSWLATLFFPHFLFAIAHTMHGMFILFSSPPGKLASWGENDPVLGAVVSPLQGMFGDSRGLHRDQRATFRSDSLPLDQVGLLTEWWINRVANTWDRLTLLTDDGAMFATALTLSRAVAESMIVNTSFNHLVRKSLMFHAIDKLASLRHKTGAAGNLSEADIWKQMISRSFLNRRLLPFVGNLAGCRTALTKMLDRVSHGLHENALTPRILRAYRNTAHGYRIRDEKVILRHGEPIDNDLPDLLSVLILYCIGSHSFLRQNKIVAR
jgi:hypothetical protein